MALESGWTYDEALFAQELEELLALQRPFTAAQSERVALLMNELAVLDAPFTVCLLYTSPSPRDRQKSRMPSSA